MKLNIRPSGDFIQSRKEPVLQDIQQRIEDQAHLYPGQIALAAPELTYTYPEMNRSASSVATEPPSAGGKCLAQVAILQTNMPERILSRMASPKGREANVSFDCNFPLNRLRTMLEDAAPMILLTDARHLARPDEFAGTRVRIIDTSVAQRHFDVPKPAVPCDPFDRAYILHTSGSTGQPKGIEFLHRNLIRTTMCLTNELFFVPSDRVSLLHSRSFGAPLVCIYCCLTNGGTLHPRYSKTRGITAMAKWLPQDRLTALQWTSSAFRQFMLTVPGGLSFPGSRIVVMASEPLKRREVEIFRRHFPKGSRMVNQVGSGEPYNYRIYPVDHQIPIKQACAPGGDPVSPERRLTILDSACRETPQRAVGQIAIHSEYMSVGYWRDPSLTRARFIQLGAGIVPPPFSSVISNAKIGNHVSIGALSGVGHDTAVGWFQIGSHCALNGTTSLGEGVTPGSHACIIPGVKVGPWAYVCAGSVVLRDVAASYTASGKPASAVGRVGPPSARRESSGPVQLQEWRTHSSGREVRGQE
jgi:non-ribosomal peptide synthetase component F